MNQINIQPRDLVRYKFPQDPKPKSGRAIIVKEDYVVLDMGGPYGRPQVVGNDYVIKVNGKPV